MARRSSIRAHFQKFLEHAQSEVGGFYEVIASGRPVEFIRPLRCPGVRVQDMRNKEKLNIHFEALTPLNEMKVLALMTWGEEDERRATGPETLTTRSEEDEPQEPGDVEFIR